MNTITKDEMGLIEHRAHACRISMTALCHRAGKQPSNWFRAKKVGRAGYKLVDPIERELTRMEAERAG